MPPRYLTKTSYVNGLGCAKGLWLAVNARERLPIPDRPTQARIAEGRFIGELAQKRFPGGLRLPDQGVQANDQTSRGLLAKRQPMFEAGFIHPASPCYARADILRPAGAGQWDIIEVKSSGSPKIEHVHDVAFQRYCYTGAGLSIRNCSLLLIDTSYVRTGEIDPGLLFKEVDITAAVDTVAPSVESNVTGLLAISQLPECPEFGRGEPFHKDEAGVHNDDRIWKDNPGSDILGLYRGGKLALELLQARVFRIRDIPQKIVLRGRQLIQHAAHKAQQVHIDRESLAAFIAGLNYPLHFVDFETFGTGVPLFDGVKPYQQVPFQFSVHTVAAPAMKPVPKSHLMMEPVDPRKGVIDSLRRAIGLDGHLVAYNATFEKRVLAELAEAFPDHAPWVEEVNQRFVDLLIPFREFAYYNPAQGGSASLKAVLPALTGRGYNELPVADGGEASTAFLYATFGLADGSKASPRERDRIKQDLERYCGQDTEGMVMIVEKLAELAAS